MNRNDIYLKTAQRIIAQLESGVIPWQKPWGTPAAQCYNAATGRVYSYLNSLLLGEPGGYCTFKQALTLGKGIRKGAKAVTIWQPFEIMKKKEDEEPEEGQEPTEEEQEDKARRFCFRAVCVFALSDVQDLDAAKVVTPEGQPQQQQDQDPDELEALINASILQDYYLLKNNIKFEETGDEAFYNLENDKITLPPSGTFTTAEEYYSTFFHEATHSTAAANRLNRKITTANLAMEEVTAELGSAFILANLGIKLQSTITNQAAYIAGWIAKIKETPSLIFRAAPKAAKAANYILSI